MTHHSCSLKGSGCLSSRASKVATVRSRAQEEQPKKKVKPSGGSFDKKGFLSSLPPPKNSVSSDSFGGGRALGGGSAALGGGGTGGGTGLVRQLMCALLDTMLLIRTVLPSYTRIIA